MNVKFILAALLLSGTAYAQQNVSTNGQRYALLTEGTGAWCQHCSDGAVFVENVLAGNPKAIAISVHNSDGMSFADGNTLDDALSDGWPWGTIDMHYFSGDVVSLNRSQWSTRVNERTALAADVDLTMTHSYDQTTRTLTVNVTAKALKSISGDYNINVYLTEDSVVGPNNNSYNQKNDSVRYNNNPSHKYYKANNDPTKWYIIGFKHMQVLRATLGGPWGVSGIKNPAANATVTKTFTYTVPAQYGGLNVKLNKLKLVAVVHKAVSGTISKTNYPDVLGSVQAKVLPWNPSGIAQVSNFTEMKVFPNPASSVIGIQALVNEPAETKVTITNAVGQTVFTKMYPAGGSMFAESISVEHLNSGLYFVTVSSNGSSVVEKLFINK